MMLHLLCSFSITVLKAVTIYVVRVGTQRQGSYAFEGVCTLCKEGRSQTRK